MTVYGAAPLGTCKSNGGSAMRNANCLFLPAASVRAPLHADQKEQEYYILKEFR